MIRWDECSEQGEEIETEVSDYRVINILAIDNCKYIDLYHEAAIRKKKDRTH